MIYCIMCNDCYDGRLVEAWSTKVQALNRLAELGKRSYYIEVVRLDEKSV